MYGITDLKPGVAIRIDGEPYLVLASQHGRKSQSQANMQTKLKNLITGAIVAQNFQGSEKIEPADVSYRRVQYLYNDDTGYTFMDLNSYDQFFLSADIVEEAIPFFVEGGEVDACFFEDRPIGIRLKPTVDLKIVETTAGVKGDTATGGTKHAKLESGLTVNVPLFIKEGETVRVNTETKQYMMRVEA